jgi:hypothetical protein
MSAALNPAFTALLGAIVGGLLSVLASWIAQRVQSKSQLIALEIQRRQQLYHDFIEATARCYADALQNNEPDPGRFSKLYGEVGRMRLHSSDAVIREGSRIVHKILEAYTDSNRSWGEIRDFLASDSVDLFSAFGKACRAELMDLQAHRTPHLKRSGARLTSHGGFENVP